MTPTDRDLPAHYRRLDAFLAKLRSDIYPEPPSPGHDVLTRQMFDYVMTIFPQAAGAKVLDVGCGQGVGLEVFRDAGLDAIGITLGEDADVCRAKGLNVRAMDMSFLDFGDAEFDLVWCRHALEHSVFPYFMLAEMHRVLKPGGVLYVEVPAPDTGPNHQNNPNHYSVLGKTMWVQLIMRAGFPQGRMRDIPLTTPMGADMYWAFTQQKPA